MIKISRSKGCGVLLFLQMYLSLPVFAQYDTLLHKPYGKNVLGIHAMYRDLINVPDSTQRAGKAEEIKRFALKHKDRQLVMNVDFFLVFWNAFYQHQPKEVSLRELKEQVKRASEENTDFLRARSLRALAEFYWKIDKNYELAFEQYLLLDKELVAVHQDDYPEIARDLMQIGEAYYFFQDYTIAITYFKRAIALPENEFNTMVINSARNTLGLCYQQLSNHDSADYYFNEVQKTNFPEAMVWKRIAMGNIGLSMYLRKKYDEAIPLLETDFSRSVKENDYGCAAGAAIALADIYMDKGKMDQSGIFITYAQDYIQKAEQPDRLRLLYPVMSKWYSYSGNAVRAQLYTDSAVSAVNNFHEKYSALKLLRAQQKMSLQATALQQAAFKLEKQSRINQRNLLLITILGLCFILVLSYFIQKRRREALHIKMQSAAHELEIAQLNLKEFTSHIAEKNKLIEELESRRSDEQKMDMIVQLRKSTILTEDDWSNFQSLFDKAYPGFIYRTLDTYPELTISELRYFVLSRLKMNYREIAAILGVSPNTVQVQRHRIRKKLNLETNEMMEEIINNM